MALSKNKQIVLNQVATVLENLDEKNPLDQSILKAIYGLAKAVVDSSAAQGETEMEGEIESGDEFEADADSEGAEVEATGDDDEVSFDEEETPAEDEGELEVDGDEETASGDDDEVSFDEEEATGDDEVSFDEEEPAAPKASRGKPAAAPAAPAADPEPDYDGMKAQEIYDALKKRGVDPAYLTKIGKEQKKEGLVKLAKNIDKLRALWLKNPNFKKPVEVVEKFVAKQGVEFAGYGRGRSPDDKKKRMLADALAAARKKPAA